MRSQHRPRLSKNMHVEKLYGAWMFCLHYFTLIGERSKFQGYYGRIGQRDPTLALLVLGPLWRTTAARRILNGSLLALAARGSAPSSSLSFLSTLHLPSFHFYVEDSNDLDLKSDWASNTRERPSSPPRRRSSTRLPPSGRITAARQSVRRRCTRSTARGSCAPPSPARCVRRAHHISTQWSACEGGAHTGSTCMCVTRGISTSIYGIRTRITKGL
ncbi:hypothetical protein BD626DRAFT_267145 [Schizophyllum amplum]|uniref:Uncharacterized protein n=1 Tax=Schizophyllum amplum TaxID=97359 RepID=A0A550BUA2_9AGAR|nr:hypothetical protein BD626DRAFT_267145 [Auriculariopsis ampla]